MAVLGRGRTREGTARGGGRFGREGDVWREVDAVGSCGEKSWLEKENAIECRKCNGLGEIR